MNGYRGKYIRYKPDHKSIGQFIRSEQVRKPTAEVANAIANEVAAASHRSNKPGEHMADKWAVLREAGFREVAGNVRVRVDVFNPDIAAAMNEFGSKSTPRRRTLARVAALYGDFHDHGHGEK